MNLDHINAIIERKRQFHPELSEALAWKSFLRVCDREDVLVLREPLPRNAMLVNSDGQWAIVISSAKLSLRHDTADGAHELGHLWVHVDASSTEREICMNYGYGDNPDPREDEADYVAQALLYGPKYFPTLAPVALLERVQRGSQLVRPVPSTIRVPGDGYSLTVVGTSFRQVELEAVCGPRTPRGYEKAVNAVVSCEAGNRYDPKAVRIEIAGRHVGYLSRDNARAFRLRYGGNSVECAAKIIGGWNAIGGGSFGVRLDLRV